MNKVNLINHLFFAATIVCIAQVSSAQQSVPACSHHEGSFTYESRTVDQVSKTVVYMKPSYKVGGKDVQILLKVSSTPGLGHPAFSICKAFGRQEGIAFNQYRGQAPIDTKVFCANCPTLNPATLFVLLANDGQIHSVVTPSSRPEYYHPVTSVTCELQ